MGPANYLLYLAPSICTYISCQKVNRQRASLNEDERLADPIDEHIGIRMPVGCPPGEYLARILVEFNPHERISLPRHPFANTSGCHYSNCLQVRIIQRTIAMPVVGLKYYLPNMVTTHAPPIPTLCAKATRAFSTCLFSACPRNWVVSSKHWASPVAPSG